MTVASIVTVIVIIVVVAIITVMLHMLLWLLLLMVMWSSYDERLSLSESFSFNSPNRAPPYLMGNLRLDFLAPLEQFR